MVRLSRLTDYGIVLMSYMATHPERVHNAAEVASDAHLPLPTVSKLLRRLAREGLLASHRGVKGGYGLAAAPEAITVGRIIRALEGPVAMTTCTDTASAGECAHEPVCPVGGHWRIINLAIRQALDSITLADMVARPGRRLADALPLIRSRTAPAAAPAAD